MRAKSDHGSRSVGRTHPGAGAGTFPWGGERKKEVNNDAVDFTTAHKGEPRASFHAGASSTEKQCRENAATPECDRATYIRNTRKRYWYIEARNTIPKVFISSLSRENRKARETTADANEVPTRKRSMLREKRNAKERNVPEETKQER